MTDVFLAGATGNLGSQIAMRLRRERARVRALVRPANGRDEKVRALAEQGVEIVEGTLDDPAERLARAMAGAAVVISAVQGAENVIVQGQANLLRAAEKAGVPRLIPSDFAIDLFRLDPGDNVFLDHRRAAHDAFSGSRVAVTSVLNGAFTDVMTAPFLEIVDWDAGTFSYWGDGEQPCDFTTVADTAAYTVAVALDPDSAGRPVRVAGDVLTMKEFHAALEHGTGRRLHLKQRGDVEDLAAEIDRRRVGATHPGEYVALQYTWGMVSGKARLDPLDNDRYPAVRPTRVAEFARLLTI
ncbi:NmrA family protein [Nonomuraea sp. MG754425]|uniref:NmrA family NAD(P)-binding protein n=1 Tax=Nonomuraea sp. MG754425 TaxID=2570319 RepID=UPI001F422245|nr:NmrA family NAD(P)-binding protein [Nonomuraea sp. MG754425]MCF6471762.1 NmrA family protein [Nonomuraea sp. MG754425]